MHWFVLKDQQYVYVKGMDSNTEWEKESKDSFVVLAIYEKVIGMDQIISLQNGSIR